MAADATTANTGARRATSALSAPNEAGGGASAQLPTTQGVAARGAAPSVAAGLACAAASPAAKAIASNARRMSELEAEGQIRRCLTGVGRETRQDAGEVDAQCARRVAE